MVFSARPMRSATWVTLRYPFTPTILVPVSMRTKVLTRTHLQAHTYVCPHGRTTAERKVRNHDHTDSATPRSRRPTAWNGAHRGLATQSRRTLLQVLPGRDPRHRH